MRKKYTSKWSSGEKDPGESIRTGLPEASTATPTLGVVDEVMSKLLLLLVVFIMVTEYCVAPKRSRCFFALRRTWKRPP